MLLWLGFPEIDNLLRCVAFADSLEIVDMLDLI